MSDVDAAISNASSAVPIEHQYDPIAMLRAEMQAMKAEMQAEIVRLNQRLEAVERRGSGRPVRYR